MVPDDVGESGIRRTEVPAVSYSERSRELYRAPEAGYAIRSFRIEIDGGINLANVKDSDSMRASRSVVAGSSEYSEGGRCSLDVYREFISCI